MEAGELVGGPGAPDPVPERVLRDLVERASAAVYVARPGERGEWLFASGSIRNLLGCEASELIADPGLWASLLHPDDRERVLAADRTASTDGSLWRLEYRVVRPDGAVQWVRDEAIVERGQDGDPLLHGLMYDITEQKRFEIQLHTRARQQAVVVELQQRALSGATMRTLAHDAVRAIRDTIAVDLSGLWWPEGDGLILRAGAGWSEGAVGSLRIPSGDRSPAGFSIDRELPVVVEDVATEDRFEVPPEVLAEGVRSAMTALVPGHEGPAGVLAVYSCQPRRFTEDDANFLQAVANVFASVLQRDRTLRQVRLQSHLLDQVAASVVVTDKTGRITYWNEASSRMFGWTFAEATETTVIDLLVAEDDRADAQRLLRRLNAGERVEMEVRLLRRDGTKMPVLLTTSTLLDGDGEIVAILGVAVDISERIAIEKELRASEERFRTAFMHSATGVVIADPDGIWVEVNDVVCQMLGYERSQIVGRSYEDFTHPADLAADHARFEELRSGTDHVSYIKRYVRRDGEPVWAEVHTSMVRGAGGGPHSLVLQINDITERKRADEEREALHEQLRQAQKMEAVGRLAGGVAHDFNNLLAVILNYAQFLADDLEPEDPRTLDVQEIRRAAERATGLTRQLLAFSRKEVVTPVVLDVEEVVEDMERLLRRTIGEDVELELDLTRGMTVEADRGHLEQVLMNLVVNARDAMPRGGRIRLTVGPLSVAPEDAAEIGVRRAGDYVVLSVQDSGEGMSPEVVEHIFEPFFTTKPRGRGTGLGLATVYGIVQGSGGTITVDTRAGEGTTFRIFLPAVLDADRPVDEAVEESSLQGGSGTILLVEDEDAVRQMVKRILMRSGYEVFDAPSGPAAIEIFERSPDGIDLVLTDVVMPHMSGREMARRLKEVAPEIRTVFMSGYADELLAGDGALGENEVLLQKPFDAADLLRVIEEAMPS